MGWSCRKQAGDTLDKIQAYCVKNSGGSSNVFTENGTSYFFEVSRKEHADGAITGSIFEMVPPQNARRAGSFRIEPDGRISRFDKIVNKAFA